MHDLFQNIQGMESGYWMWLPMEDHMPGINLEEKVLTLDPLPTSLRLYINTEQFFPIFYPDTELMYTILWNFFISRLGIKFYVLKGKLF